MTDQIITVQPAQNGRFLGRISIALLIIIIVLLTGTLGYGYVELMKTNHALKRLSSDLRQQISHDQSNINELQKAAETVQQVMQKAQTLSVQQEQMITEWQNAQKGDLEKWHLAEAQYLVKLANDHLQFTHNIPLALVMVQRANQIVQNIQSSQLVALQKSLTNDITRLQTIPQNDTTDLYARLTALNNQIDQLPMPSSPLKADLSLNTNSEQQTKMSWWQAGLEQSWQALRRIVIVRYNTTQSLPLILPEEKSFLYQNLHTQMENARWAVLYQNKNIYQTSLMHMVAWVKQYFVQDAPETKTMLQQLQALQTMLVQPPDVNLSATMQLFDAYFSQAEQAKTTT